LVRFLVKIPEQRAAKRLYDAADEPKKLVAFAIAAHADLLAHDPVHYRNESSLVA